MLLEGLFMFTGLIEVVCTVKAIRQKGAALELSIDLDSLSQNAKIGDSIAINGICLTVCRLDGRIAGFDVSEETVSKTTIGKCRPLSEVNIELALKAADRFGGHFVTGHIDGTAAIEAIEKKAKFADIRFTAASLLLENMIPKGSVAIDGISLTITNLDKNSFSVALIPETLKNTTLGKAKVGDKVNIETDMIVKTIRKQLGNILPKQDKLTVEKLKEAGF